MRQDSQYSITATELVRNLATMIDRVRISGQSLLITKGSQTVAELRPPPQKGCPVDQLPDLLKALPALGDDAEVMAQDLRGIKDRASLPERSWD